MYLYSHSCCSSLLFPFILIILSIIATTSTTNLLKLPFLLQ
ncbi:hypothetical protein BFJ67_g8979 [Fusarium oxysporum f. sp. cepae]|nr:hypothetical protein BFJ67_g8979 [Fusarium oxysporum f. sp. cepae]